MFGLSETNPAVMDQGFLPEDYLQRRAERRTNMFALTLFGVVMVGVVGAFLVTNRQWHDVKRYQEAINVRYAQAARDIEQLKTLEAQRAQLLEKAELTTALLERVPRSVLLAELINRMPTDVTLLDLEVKSTRTTNPPPTASADTKSKRGGGQVGRTARAASRAEPDARQVIQPPRYHTKVTIVGVTSSHTSVARYVASLQQCPLLSSVELKFSEKTAIKNREMNRFRIETEIRPEADARRIEPLAAPRLTGDPFLLQEGVVGSVPDTTNGGEP